MELTPELITAVGAALVGVLGAWNARQGRRLKALEERVGALTTWRTVATDYIAALRFAMVERGIKPPPVPPELGLIHGDEPAPPGPPRDG